MAEPGPKRRKRSKGPAQRALHLLHSNEIQVQHSTPESQHQKQHGNKAQHPGVQAPVSNKHHTKQTKQPRKPLQQHLTKQTPPSKIVSQKKEQAVQASSVDLYASALHFFDTLTTSTSSQTSAKTSTTITPKVTSTTMLDKPTFQTVSSPIKASSSSLSSPSPNLSSNSTLSNPQLASSSSTAVKLTGWDWFRAIGSPKCILGPMVGQSELAFRMLCRRYGVNLCYSPMFVSSKFIESKHYRDEVWSTCPQDRPLIVQFCGNDPSVLLQAAQLVQHQCDAIDINLGCPQEVAKRQNYGAFLMDNLPLVRKLVSTLASSLTIPVVCKIRRFADPTKTIQYAKMLEEAGCSLVAIHPRTREQKEEILADWDTARVLKSVLKIPVVLNGDLWHAEDVQACLKVCSLDGFMSAQGLLHNPALFEKVDWKIKSVEGASIPNAPFIRRRRQFGPTTSFHLAVSFSNPRGISSSTSSGIANSSFFSTAEDVYRQFRLASEYCDLVEKYPVGHPSVFRRHIFFLLFDCFQANVDCYEALFTVTSPTEARPLLERLLYRAESGKLHPRPSDKKMVTRRDGSLAPPPWPVGGGQLSEHEGSKVPSKSPLGQDKKLSVKKGKKRNVRGA